MPETSTRNGFSLIETIAAIVILSIAVPPVLWAVREAHVHRVNPVMASTARWLATEKLEDLIADRHSTTIGYAGLVGGTESPVPGFPGFDRTATINEHGAWDNGSQSWQAGTGYKTITVDVSWTDGGAAARTLSVSSVVTEYTP
jgi:prepilin-type N-terminal cleavage/methylation domain-containing protein